MSSLRLLLIALGLSMDAFAVSVTTCLSLRRRCFPDALQLGVVFGGFQALMPVLGWMGGIGFRRVMAPVDHWIAFSLLTIIGIRMIRESRRPPQPCRRNSARHLLVLLTLGVATSIDALAVGLTFAFLGVAILTPVLVIGAVTFVMSFAGVYLGKRFGHLFERRIEALGGLILIAIGTHILWDHISNGP